MFDKCWTECSNVSTPFNIIENKGKVESILNESLNQIKFDSTWAFNIFHTFNNTERPGRSNAPDIWFNKVLNAYRKQLLKPFQNGPVLKSALKHA